MNTASMKTVFDIMPDLNFDTPTLGNYYPTKPGDDFGNGDDE